VFLIPAAAAFVRAGRSCRSSGQWTWETDDDASILGGRPEFEQALDWTSFWPRWTMHEQKLATPVPVTALVAFDATESASTAPLRSFTTRSTAFSWSTHRDLAIALAAYGIGRATR